MQETRTPKDWRRASADWRNTAQLDFKRRRNYSQHRKPTATARAISRGSRSWIRRSGQTSPDVSKLDGTQFRGVTVLTAGVPCQPASQAGKRRGAADDRWLWPEALRILREAMPTYAIFENPPGILSLDEGVQFERLLAEMESYGYAVQP